MSPSFLLSGATASLSSVTNETIASTLLRAMYDLQDCRVIQCCDEAC